MKLGKEFLHNPVPVLNSSHLELMQRLRENTIELLSDFYPGAYRIDPRTGKIRFMAKGRPALRGTIDDLTKELELMYTPEVVEQLKQYETQLTPEFESQGFYRILNDIRPSIMDSGPSGKEQLVKISVQGTARCMHCFDYAVRRGSESSGKGFFKIHETVDGETEKIHIATATIDELLKDWQEIIPTDVKYAADRSLLSQITPRVCLARGKGKPDYRHAHDIVPLSFVIVLEYITQSGERVRHSHVLHMRHKSGFERERKLMQYLIGQRYDVMDGIGSRSIVPDDAYAKVFVTAIRDYQPYRGTLKGAIFAANYHGIRPEDMEGAERLNRAESSMLKRLLKEMKYDTKDAYVVSNGEKRHARDIEWRARFGPGNSVWDQNIIDHKFYTDAEYTRMNGVKGQDDMDYQIRREETANGTYTAAHWKILELLSPMIFDQLLRSYAERVVAVHLNEARKYRTMPRKTVV